MSALTRFSLVLAAFSLGSAQAAPGENAPAPAHAAATDFPVEFYVGDAQQPTTSHVAKLGSDISFSRGRFDGALLGLNGRVPLTGKDTNCKQTRTNLCADSEVIAKVFVKLPNVKVDGKPLDVGPDCRTAQSAEVPLKALLPLAFPAPPARLFTGLVSGPGTTLATDLMLRRVGSSDPNGCGTAP